MTDFLQNEAMKAGFKPTTHREIAEAYVRGAIPELKTIEVGYAGTTPVTHRPEIKLNDWLRVLPASFILDVGGGLREAQFGDKSGIGKVVLYFNLTTGQPATEADYQAFNQIVGV